MSNSRKRLQRATATVVIATVGITGIGATTAAAHSAPAPVVVSSSVPAGVVTTTLPSAALPSGTTTDLAPAAGASTPQALPGIAIRLAVRAALEVVKRTSRSTYNLIVSYVARGKTAFVNWWNSTGKELSKRAGFDVTIGISGAALYDVIKWILGF